MIREKTSREFIINLDGPGGNAYALLGTASRLAKQLDLDFDQIHEEMTSGDYENLIEVFDSYFGDYVVLER